MPSGRKTKEAGNWVPCLRVDRALLRRQPRNPDEPIFCNRYWQKLGAAGVRFQLSHYVESASKKTPTLSSKRISPHTFRQATRIWIYHPLMPKPICKRSARHGTSGIERPAVQATALEAKTGPCRPGWIPSEPAQGLMGRAWDENSQKHAVPKIPSHNPVLHG